MRSISERGRSNALLLLAIVWPLSSAEATANERWPTHVAAKFEIAFAGVQVGWFTFDSRINGDAYALEGRGKVSALFGAFKWSGRTQSSGLVGRGSPDPRRYIFDYKANSERGAVRMAFARHEVTQLELKPNKPRSRNVVPVLPEHLKDVFDPLSAIIAMTRVRDGHPCQKQLAIFDGKQRFNLVLHPAGRERVGNNGAPPGYICRVRYVPIAGYKPNQVTRFMAQSKGIRIIMRRVPGAGVVVPFEVRLPTLVGDAVMRSRKTVIVTADKQRIALVN
jgi:Protein of unknown function (DUF3108)